MTGSLLVCICCLFQMLGNFSTLTFLSHSHSSQCYSLPGDKMAAKSPDITFISKAGKGCKSFPSYVGKVKAFLDIPSRLSFTFHWSELLDKATSSSKEKWERVFLGILLTKVRILLAQNKRKWYCVGNWKDTPEYILQLSKYKFYKVISFKW